MIFFPTLAELKNLKLLTRQTKKIIDDDNDNNKNKNEKKNNHPFSFFINPAHRGMTFYRIFFSLLIKKNKYL